MARLLVVEDDETIGDALRTSLRAHGHEVQWERSGRGALSVSFPVDLVLLDLGLPDLDGVEVCRRLRAGMPAAVLVILTARTDEMDVVVGLEAGADDYLSKPVRLAELHARLRAHLRRNAGTGGGEDVPIGDLLVDTDSRRVTLAGHEVALRAKEFDLLARLAAEPDRAISRETLMADVWDENWFGSTKTLDVHVAAVRRKLADAAAGTGAQVPAIVTLRGHGYRFDTPETQRQGQ
ncbi:MAG TPA: response regulator transcription factor [Pseudonocardia sp.]